MPDKLTDNEILKALKCCAVPLPKFKCDECPAWVNSHCTLKTEDIIDLINRLQARVEKAEKVEHFADKTIATLQAENERLSGEISKARRKALLEAKEKFAGHSDYHGDTILCKLICMAEGKEVGNAKPLDKSEIKAEAYKECIEKAKKLDFEIQDGKVIFDWKDFNYALKELVGEDDASTIIQQPT